MIDGVGALVWLRQERGWKRLRGNQGDPGSRRTTINCKHAVLEEGVKCRTLSRIIQAVAHRGPRSSIGPSWNVLFHRNHTLGVSKAAEDHVVRVLRAWGRVGKL